MEFDEILGKLNASTSKWIENNIEYINPLIENNYADKKLKIKVFVEFLFLDNMFYPNYVFNKKIRQNIIDTTQKVIKKIDFNNYFVFNNSLSSGATELAKFSNNLAMNLINLNKLQLIINTNADVMPERPPFRKIDIKYSIELIGLKSNFPDMESLYNQTILAKDFNFLYLSDNVSYSITHTIFYVTDMGRKVPDYINVSKVKELIFKLSNYYLLIKNYDILSELLLSLIFIEASFNESEKETVKNLFYAIYQAQESNGMIPAPIEIKSKDSIKRFYNYYHTTMVVLGASYGFLSKTSNFK
ncbi:MAG: hypothetical protein LBC17_03385 [Lactobacillaceae bacterium]|nr:hypothetical protein [Lactobacillaceae bacterium]